MPHQFTIGDVVKLKHTDQEGVVKGLANNGEFLWVTPTSPPGGDLYFRADNVTLVRQAIKPVHPRKIET